MDIENESNQKKISTEYVKTELPDSWWYRVYFAVVIFTILVISALALFSRHFS